MSLDVYVGSLTRYYVGDWQSVGDKTAQPGKIKKDCERIGKAVLAWREVLGRSLAPHLGEPLGWDESEVAPWFTARPGWDGFGSLVLWAAYAEQPTLRRPAALPKEWDDDAALVRSNAEGFRSRYSHLVRNVELWLPNPFDFTFEGEDVDGRRVVVGSTATLRRQLEELNAATWKADDEVVAAWGRDALADNAPLEQNARYAFAVLLDLAERSVEMKLPMKLDH